MGMSTHVTAFRDLDGKFKEMMEIKKFCEAKRVSYPTEVSEYFGKYINDNEKDILESLSEVKIGKAVRSFTDESSDIYEIDLKDLPKDVKTIRFYNSW